jgi:two-component system sensor kinase FixL
MTDLKLSPSAADRIGLAAEGESELRSTVDDAGIGTWSWNLVTGQIGLSRTCARLLGAPRLEFASLEMLQALVHPADRDVRTAGIQRAIDHGGAYDIDYRVIKPDGRICWLRSRACGDGPWWHSDSAARCRLQH